MPEADSVTFDFKTVLTIVFAVVAMGGAWGAAAYRIGKLEEQVAAQTVVIEELQRSQVELITTLRVKEIIR